MTASTEARAEVLRRLVAGELEPAMATAALRRYGWDSDVDLVAVEPADVRRALDGPDVVAWAEALEMREDVGMADAVRQVVAELANPLLYGPPDRAALLRRLG